MRTKYLDSSSVFLPPAPLGNERKIKSVKSQKEKAGNLFIILNMVEVKKARMLFIMLRFVKKKRIELLFTSKGYQRE